METRFVFGRFTRVAFIAMAVSPLLHAQSEPEAHLVDPDSAEARPYRDTGDRAIDRFGYTLVTEATEAVTRNDLVAGIAAGHLRGLPTINGNIAGVARITAIKVVSLKTRDPANAPDAAEKRALFKVENDLDTGTPPEILVQRLDGENGKTEWRVYKPLAILKQCVACHGPTDNLAPEVKAALDSKFPDDKATGYRVGEWAGLIRVTVADPPAAAKPTPTPTKK
jgi:hypothetical protein